MKIVVVRRYVDDLEYGEQQELRVDGESACRVGGGEPEDNRIGRDLVPCTRIADLMKLAFEAGQRGEAFDVEVVVSDDDD